LDHYLFAAFHGVIPWCPVVVLGVVGLVIGGCRGHRGAWLLLALFAWQIGVNASSRPVFAGNPLGSRTWTAGTSFGPRKLLDAMPLLLPAAGWLRDAAHTTRGRAVIASVAVGLTLPTAALLLAAVVEPSVVERVVDGPQLRRLMRLGFSGDMWSRALAARRVPITMVVAVGVPVLALFAGVTIAAHRLASANRLQRLATLVLGGAVLAHGWLALVKVRTDLIVAEDPARIQRAAVRMWPAHVNMITEAISYRQSLRVRFGDDVAPP